MNSDISVSTTSWRADRAGSGRFPQAVPTWAHFGANLGAAGGELCLQSASDDLRQPTEFELGGAGQMPDVVAPKTLREMLRDRDIL